jgi:hypothetical protein
VFTLASGEKVEQAKGKKPYVIKAAPGGSRPAATPSGAHKRPTSSVARSAPRRHAPPPRPLPQRAKTAGATVTTGNVHARYA